MQYKRSSFVPIMCTYNKRNSLNNSKNRKLITCTYVKEKLMFILRLISIEPATISLVKRYSK